MADTQYQVLTGDPGNLRVKAQAFKDLADRIMASKNALESIKSDSTTVSEAMDAVRELSGQVLDDITATEGLYRTTGEILVTYAGELEEAKRVADDAACQISNLESNSSWLEKDRDYKWTRYLTAVRYYEDAVTTESDYQWWWRQQRDLRYGEYVAAVTAVNNHANDLAFQQRRWTNNDGWGGGKEKKDVAAAEATAKMNGIFDNPAFSGLKDTFWDKAGDLWEQFSSILKKICDIASLLSLFLSWVPILGQVLLALTLIGALLTIINTCIQFAHGEIGWGSLLLGVGLGVLDIFASKLKCVTEAVKGVLYGKKAMHVLNNSGKAVQTALKFPKGGTRYVTALNVKAGKVVKASEINKARAVMSGHLTVTSILGKGKVVLKNLSGIVSKSPKLILKSSDDLVCHAAARAMVTKDLTKLSSLSTLGKVKEMASRVVKVVKVSVKNPGASAYLANNCGYKSVSILTSFKSGGLRTVIGKDASNFLLSGLNLGNATKFRIFCVGLGTKAPGWALSGLSIANSDPREKISGLVKSFVTTEGH